MLYKAVFGYSIMLIDFFHNLYNATYNLSWPWLNKIKLPAIFRLFILQTANVIIPLTFYIQKNPSKYGLINKNTTQTDFTVSLTSFPQRIGKVHLVIESMLRQTYVPNRIILWLSSEQFPSLSCLPNKLLLLQKRGLEIYLTPGDLRSYKKYYFLLKEQPNTPFIIIDDDIFYPSKLLEKLVKTHQKHPEAICTNRCTQILADEPYIRWKGVKGRALSPRYDIMPTGCGGVLYPANALHPDALNESLFTTICKDADDIWLNCTAYLNNRPTAYTGGNQYFLAINSFNNLHLHSKNIGQSNNDICINNVRAHYKLKESIDIFKRDI